MYTKLFLISLVFAVIAIYFNTSILYSLFQTLGPLETSPRRRLFTSDELKQYNGIDKPQLYLAILGKVFNVSKGWAHYGPGESYNIFVGRDSSRSFITGQFSENETSDQVADLSQEELRSLNHWLQFYTKDYPKVGKLIGRFYKENGKLTQYGREVKKLIQAAEKAQEDKEEEKLKYPPCNIEWDAAKGTRVWCTNQSGGIQRNWVGVPRQFYEPGSQSYRCACVNPKSDTANLKPYEGCESESETCFVKPE